jgi:hypothetical protein
MPASVEDASESVVYCLDVRDGFAPGIATGLV